MEWSIMIEIKLHNRVEGAANLDRVFKEGDIWFEAWLARRRSLHKDLGGRGKPQVEAVASVKIFRWAGAGVLQDALSAARY